MHSPILVLKEDQNQNSNLHSPLQEASSRSLSPLVFLFSSFLRTDHWRAAAPAKTTPGADSSSSFSLLLLRLFSSIFCRTARQQRPVAAAATTSSRDDSGVQRGAAAAPAKEKLREVSDAGRKQQLRPFRWSF